MLAGTLAKVRDDFLGEVTRRQSFREKCLPHGTRPREFRKPQLSRIEATLFYYEKEWLPPEQTMQLPQEGRKRD